MFVVGERINGMYTDIKKAIQNKKIVLVPFCNTIECEDKIKAKFEGVKSLNSPLDSKSVKTKCLFCGKEAKELFYFGKSY